ncbi:hypothetical protein EC991_001407 [Linnemannia zychae]|nr:hypothetical protein EC991_001407 [Linnemannia zychae]
MASTAATRASLAQGSALLLTRLILPIRAATCFDCPELPDKPSWSLSSILDHRDRIQAEHIKKGDDITPETIHHLLNLAHLHKPSDPKILHELERDVRRMRHFLDYIQSCDTQAVSSAADCSRPLESLRSLVDDGAGLRLRPSTATSPSASSSSNEQDQSLKREEARQGAERRDMLLERPVRVKGNFFVVGAELDPKQEN